ncbi:hypothetical protein Vadar_023321 [Vaccinium darrowii]|uniref:Uncharacterized protein n=1 Tax=Vaccinium darrowii TaxID=229202 RepID=A0ACB7Z623_9ERIC|nr:hypothetical protein Vadar_023321 [Vaccinium darrowii]
MPQQPPPPAIIDISTPIGCSNSAEANPDGRRREKMEEQQKQTHPLFLHCLRGRATTKKRGKRKERCKLLYWLYDLCLIAVAAVLKDSPAPLEQCLKDSRTTIKGNQMLKFELRKSSASSIPHQMINDQDLGFISNFLGTFIPLLVTAYHYVIADLKCEGSSKDQAGCNVFLDAKHALDPAFAATTGVNTENLLMSPPDWCAH